MEFHWCQGGQQMNSNYDLDNDSFSNTWSPIPHRKKSQDSKKFHRCDFDANQNLLDERMMDLHSTSRPFGFLILAAGLYGI
jgi:hypothetical protein